MAITTIARVRRVLTLEASQSADDDALLTELINAVTERFERETGRALASAARTEKQVYRGRGKLIIPSYYPVTAVATVTVDGTAVAAAASWTGTGWYLANDQIHLRGTTVEQGSLVELAYTAGYTSVPQDLEQAACDLIALKFRERPFIGTSSVNAAGYSISILPTVLPRDVQAVLESYRVPGVA